MSMPRKPLADILPGGGGDDDILDRFDATEAAGDYDPLPRGTYTAVAVSGGRTTAATGTPGYTVEFRITDGPHAGRRVWKTWYLTQAALPYTKKGLAKLGLDTKAKLTGPFPADRLVCKLILTVRARDDGSTVNEVKDVSVIRVQEPTADPFAPPADGDAAEPPAGDTDFPFGATGRTG
ncbi:MAG: hypothetical protein U0871_25120 [Gemmataceae bacterium]